MTINSDKIREIIFESIEEINLQLAKDKQIQKSDDGVLYGPKSVLDSLGLVNLIIDIEQRFHDKTEISINLADEKALSQKNSPYLTVKSLSDYISKLLKVNTSV